jgi:hypothetical protein
MSHLFFGNKKNSIEIDFDRGGTYFARELYLNRNGFFLKSVAGPVVKIREKRSAFLTKKTDENSSFAPNQNRGSNI